MPHPEVPDDYRPPPDEGGAVTWRRSDLNLMRRAAREGWGVPDELKTESLLQAAKILTTSPHERNKIAVMKFLAAVDLAERREDRKDRDAGTGDAPDPIDPGLAEAALKALNGTPDEPHAGGGGAAEEAPGGPGDAPRDA